MTQHLEFFVEESSMEAFLQGLLPRFLPESLTFAIYPFQGKHDLLSKLEGRLQTYRRLLQDWRLIVAIDQDDEDCYRLKQKLSQSLQEQAHRHGQPRSQSGKLQIG